MIGPCRRHSRSSLLLCLAAGSLAAQSSDNDLEKALKDLLNTPVTTATKTAVSLRDVPAAMTVITRNDIETYGYQSLDQALARIPEVYVHFEGHDTDADFRGFFSNNVHRRVLYLLNGHRLNDRFHFGDFLPDTIQDLSNVEQIEVIRGPGAALYGSVAVLGVVNIITRDGLKAANRTSGQVSLAADDYASGSSVKRVQAGFSTRWSERRGMAVDFNWFDGEVDWDSRTSGLARPWVTSFSPDGKAKLLRSTDAYFDVEGSFVGGTSFSRGKDLPNFTLQVNLDDFTVGAFLHTHRVTWAWPKDTDTFGNSSSDRSWGTSAVYVDWKPKAMEQWELSMRASYNWNTNRELADFSATDYIKDAAGAPTATSLFVQRIAGVAGGNAFIDATGTNYRTGTGIDPTLLTDAAALAHGGGGRTNYAGIDKSFGYEFQLSPLRSEQLLITVGGNYERADYVNKQWLSFRDGTFIGWTGGGGIKDNGYYYGVWTQAIWTPLKVLTITAGLRYDKQVIQDVYRELGGDQILYRRLGTGPFTYEQLRFKNVSSKDLTPRIAANWRITESQNLRAIYAKAFRAVPPQEVIRLPRDFGDAESEQINDYELIYNISPSFTTNLAIHGFRQSSNVVYAFNPSLPGTTTGGFTKGSGFTTSGLSADFRWIGVGWEFWSNATYYKLDRASDAFSFMKEYKTAGTPALLNMNKPLDSPTRLFKAGYSRYFDSGTSLSGELHYNGTITSLTPLNLNAGDPNPATPGTPNYLEHEVPSSTTVTVSCRQDFSPLGWKGGFGVLKITNLLDAKVNGVLNMDSQNWNANTYGKPTQIPGFGRQFSLQVGYRF